MTSLVDRYVFTALRRIPEQQRADIDRELRASIEDAVDARVEAGQSREAAVEETLSGLGDPDRLADSYAGRPSYLIGPELYQPWRRLVLTLLSAPLPIVVAVVVVLQLFDGRGIGDVIGTAVTTTLTVGTQMVFWITLVFFIVQRTGTGKEKLHAEWTLGDLPKYESNGMSAAQLAVGLAWPVLLIAALVLQQFTFTDVPLLDPAKWTSWWPYLIVVSILQGFYTVWAWRLGTWNRTVTAVNTVLELAFAVPMIWLLASDDFFNPAFHRFADLGTSEAEVRRWVSLGVIAIVLLAAARDIAEVALRGERARRGLPTKVPGSGSYHFG